MKAFFCSLLLSFCIDLSAQIKNISTQSFDSLFTEGRVYYLCEGGKNYYGCGENLEGLPLDILFTSITINLSNNEVHMIGYSYSDINNKDTLGIASLKVFLAKPKQDRLINKKIIANLNDKNINTSKLKWRSQTGYFDITFIYEEDMNLYFVSDAPFCMKEHRIKELFGK